MSDGKVRSGKVVMESSRRVVWEGLGVRWIDLENNRLGSGGCEGCF